MGGVFLEIEVDEILHIDSLLDAYLFYIDGLLSDVFYMWSCDSYLHLLELWLLHTIWSCDSFPYSMCILSFVAWILFGANRTPPFNPWSKKECVFRDSVCRVLSIDVFAISDLSEIPLVDLFI